jgi:electron transfer flavoprotein alpha/beta subunit
MSAELAIAVCVRPPEPGAEEGSLATRDLAALEYAVQLARREGGRITAVAAGSDECVTVLQQCVARGAHASVHVTVEAQSPDPLETARLLHEPVRALAPTLVLCGTKSDAGMHGAVPRELARLLGLSFVGSVVELDIDLGASPATVRAVQGLEHGDRWTWGAALPLVCGVDRELCSPRYLAVRRARRAESHRPGQAEPTPPDETAVDTDSTRDFRVEDRVVPRIRPKKSKVATAKMSSADRMKMLRSGGKAPAAAGSGGGDDDKPKRVTGDPQKGAQEIIALLEKRELLKP